MIRYLILLILCLVPSISFAVKPRNTVESLLLEYGRSNRPIYKQHCAKPKAYSEIFYVCLYLDYLDSGNASRFLSGIPENKDDLDGLWQDNMLAFSEIIPPSPLPPIMHGGSFSDLFINVIYQLMLKGNATAYKKYFYLYYNESEEYGEGMDEQLDQLIKDHPMAVLRDWHILSSYLQHTALETSEISYQKTYLLNKYTHICVTDGQLNHLSCQEVINWLSQLPTPKDLPPSRNDL